MPKKKILILAFISLQLFACTLTSEISKTPAGAPTPSPDRIVQASATMEETLPPTPNYSPTPNTLDTEIAHDKQNNIEQGKIADKRLDAANKEMTVSSDSKTAITRKETDDQGAINAAGTQLVISGTNDEAARRFQIMVPTIIVAGTQAMFTAQKEQSAIVYNYLIGLAAVLFSAAVVIAVVIPRKVPPKSQPKEQQGNGQAQGQSATSSKPESQPRKFIPVNKNGLGLHLSPPGNHAHFMEFLMKVTTGKKGFSKPEWETADSPYNRETYKVVYNWLWQYKLIELPPGGKIRFTDMGKGWAENWIDANFLHSPVEDELPISTTSLGEISQPPENQPPESGGEVVLHEDKDESDKESEQ